MVNIPDMEKDIEKFLKEIKNIRTIKLAEAVGVSRNMAEKYKNFSNYPSLDKAILIEDSFGIPARAWVDIRKYKEKQGEK
jgi:transcriptional regulator with XRE-family HTH domain